MKKLLILLLCMAALVVSGCGDKFAKEKEILTRIKNGESTMKIYGFDQIR
jgi:outer membrane lipoprotein-sorting protein